VAGKAEEDAADFVSGEDGREAIGSSGADEVWREVERDLEHILIEKEQGAEGQVPGGGGDVSIHGQVSDAPRGFDFRAAQVAGVAFVMEEDKAGDPV